MKIINPMPTHAPLAVMFTMVWCPVQLLPTEYDAFMQVGAFDHRPAGSVWAHVRFRPSALRCGLPGLGIRGLRDLVL